MARTSTLMYLEKAPKSLRDLEIQIDKSLKPFMTGTWRKPMFDPGGGWGFDWVSIETGTIRTIIFDGPSGIDFSKEWSKLSNVEKKKISIDEVLEKCKFQTYYKTEDITEDLLEEILSEGVILFPDGSIFSQANFQVSRDTEEKAIRSMDKGMESLILEAILSLTEYSAGTEVVREPILSVREILVNSKAVNIKNSRVSNGIIEATYEQITESSNEKTCDTIEISLAPPSDDSNSRRASEIILRALLKKPGAALILCTFHERPSF